MPQDPDDRTLSGPGLRPDAGRRAPLDAHVLDLPILQRLRTLIDDLAARSDPEVPR